MAENVLPEPSPTNVTNSLFSQPSLFQVGSHAANNISPEDRNGWIRLARADARTLLTVKLWRGQATSNDALARSAPQGAADLEYVIEIHPERAAPAP
jgi:hypothetical protein